MTAREATSQARVRFLKFSLGLAPAMMYRPTLGMPLRTSTAASRDLSRMSAKPPLVRATVQRLQSSLPELQLNLHFHNTRGIGLVNVMEGLALGITSYESSLAGIGGCPFAPGATGNICSEDTVHLMQQLGIETGIDLEKLAAVALRMEGVLGRTLPGQVMRSGPRLRRYQLEEQPAAVG